MALLGAGYLRLWPEVVGAVGKTGVGDRLTFAHKWDLLMFLWLAGCVDAVSQTRLTRADRKCLAFGPPRTGDRRSRGPFYGTCSKIPC